MKIVGRRGAMRSLEYVVPLVAAGCGLVLALGGCAGSSGTAAAAPARPSRGSAYTLMEMNLCLSGLATCYPRVQYPAVVQEAISRIRAARPDAVTFTEACSGDVELIARRTGYNLRVSKVIYNRKPLPCIRPGGRGLFGDAVLTRAAILSSASQPFQAQAGPERRVWLCATTRIGIDVCAAQLASPAAVEAAANAPQCAELRAVLARRAATRPVIFGGDLNRRPSCAPPGFWTRTDSSAHQDPGSQQVYGTAAFRSPLARVVPAIHTDHDVLLVRAYLSATDAAHSLRRFGNANGMLTVATQSRSDTGLTLLGLPGWPIQPTRHLLQFNSGGGSQLWIGCVSNNGTMSVPHVGPACHFV